MFERYTDRARRVIVLSQEEARRLGHTWIGTEHLLLALLREGDGVGAQILSRSGINVARVLPQITQLTHSAQEEGRATAGLPAGPTARRRAGRAGAGDAMANRLARIEARLTAIERRLGESARGAGG